MGVTPLLPGSTTLLHVQIPPLCCVMEGNTTPLTTGEQIRLVGTLRVLLYADLGVSVQSLGVANCSGIKKSDLDRWTERCRKVSQKR